MTSTTILTVEQFLSHKEAVTARPGPLSDRALEQRVRFVHGSPPPRVRIPQGERYGMEPPPEGTKCTFSVFFSTYQLQRDGWTKDPREVRAGKHNPAPLVPEFHLYIEGASTSDYFFSGSICTAFRVHGAADRDTRVVELTFVSSLAYPDAPPYAIRSLFQSWLSSRVKIRVRTSVSYLPASEAWPGRDEVHATVLGMLLYKELT